MDEPQAKEEKGLDLSPEEIDKILAEEARHYIWQSIEENGMEF